MLFPTIDQCVAVVDTECVSHLLVYVPNIWHWPVPGHSLDSLLSTGSWSLSFSINEQRMN